MMAFPGPTACALQDMLTNEWSKAHVKLYAMQTLQTLTPADGAHGRRDRRLTQVLRSGQPRKASLVVW